MGRLNADHAPTCRDCKAVNSKNKKRTTTLIVLFPRRKLIFICTATQASASGSASLSLDCELRRWGSAGITSAAYANAIVIALLPVVFLAAISIFWFVQYKRGKQVWCEALRKTWLSAAVVTPSAPE